MVPCSKKKKPGGDRASISTSSDAALGWGVPEDESAPLSLQGSQRWLSDEVPIRFVPDRQRHRR
jgi:hypothetical protein